MSQKDQDLAKLYRTQKGLHEWLEDIGSSKAERMHEEDKEKRERLRYLNEVIDLPYDKPVQFTASDLQDKSAAFLEYLEGHGQDLCAIRLIPVTDGVPKLRMRGLSVEKAVEWFKEQDVNASKYRVDFVPHEICVWSAIFVVTENGVIGEVIQGGHYQLTQGFFESSKPITFQYDFRDWSLSPGNTEVEKHLRDVIGHVKVEGPSAQKEISKQLGGLFSHGYLRGYYETTFSIEYGLMFKDYNQLLEEMFADAALADHGNDSDGVALSGQVGSPGKATGPVQIVAPDEIDPEAFAEGTVLVCPVTTPAYVPLMKKAAAIVTDQGGILSHAAIVARELGVPCIVGTGTATEALKNGQRVTVDADSGSITVQ